MNYLAVTSLIYGIKKYKEDSSIANLTKLVCEAENELNAMLVKINEFEKLEQLLIKSQGHAYEASRECDKIYHIVDDYMEKKYGKK